MRNHDLVGFVLRVVLAVEVVLLAQAMLQLIGLDQSPIALVRALL